MTHLPFAAIPPSVVVAVLVVVACAFLAQQLHRHRQKKSTATTANPGGSHPAAPAIPIDAAAFSKHTHDYLLRLHSTVGASFFAAAAHDATAPTTTGGACPAAQLFTRDPGLCASVLTKGKLFAPARCPAHLFRSSATHGFASRSAFDLVQPMARGTVFDITDDEWKRQRRALAPCFAVRDADVTQFASAAGDLIASWPLGECGPAADGATDADAKDEWRTADLQMLSYVLCVKGTLLTLFGPGLRLSPQQWAALQEGVLFFQRRFAGSRAAAPLGEPDDDAYACTVHAVCRDAVRWGLAHKEQCDPGGGFRLLLDQCNPDEATLVATMANFVVAAAESPASGLAHTLAQIAVLPACDRKRVTARVRAEFQAARPPSSPPSSSLSPPPSASSQLASSTQAASTSSAWVPFDKAALARLRFADALVCEGMRHKAPATMVVREAVAETTLRPGGRPKAKAPAAAVAGGSKPRPGGCSSADANVAAISLRPGDKVHMCLHALHHDPTVWDAPERFVPDRFFVLPPCSGEEGADGGNKAKAARLSSARKKSFLPFSKGSRGCPGGPLSMMWMAVGLSLLLERFEVRPAAGATGAAAADAAAAGTGHEGNHIAKFVSWAPRGIPVNLRLRA